MKEQGSKYYQKNNDLAVDLITVLDAVKLKLQHKLHINMNCVQEITPPQMDDTLEISEEGELEEVGINCDPIHFQGSQPELMTAKRMLSHPTLIGYNEIRKSFLDEFKIPKEWLPSFYMLTKNRPKMQCFTYKVGSLNITLTSTVNKKKSSTLSLQNVPDPERNESGELIYEDIGLTGA